MYVTNNLIEKSNIWASTIIKIHKCTNDTKIKYFKTKELFTIFTRTK